MIDAAFEPASRGRAAAFSCPSGTRRAFVLGTAGALLGGCAAVPLPAARDDWHEVRLPGKEPTRYHWGQKDGRRVLAAQADRSASMWRRKLERASAQVGEVEWSWRVDQLIDGADVSVAEREDAPARVLFGFGGDRTRLSARNRMMFELAHALSGEEPPYATLMYVWATHAPLDSVVINPRTDRVRKIVLDTGPGQLGRWREHRRHLAHDYRRAFGEEPGPLLSVAVMTDADNTRSRAQAWYGPIRFY